jgi:prepilin-type N-terminal cleavage/methylation domain-containing protein
MNAMKASILFRHAFTLIEMLVVIAVIGTGRLAASGVPHLGRQRKANGLPEQPEPNQPGRPHVLR